MALPPVSRRILILPESGRMVVGRRHWRGGRDDLLAAVAVALVLKAARLGLEPVRVPEVTVGDDDGCVSRGEDEGRGLFFVLLLFLLLPLLGPNLPLLPSSDLLLASLIGLVLFMLVVCSYL